MSDLVEHILSENYVEASNVFEDRLNHILEMKIVEMKKIIQAEGMVGMGMSRKEMEARKEAGYVPAHYSKEKGGLGLSDYDIGREETKKRLAKRAKEAKSTKKSKKKVKIDEAPNLKQVDPKVVQSFIDRDSLKGRRDRLLAKAAELDKRGSGKVDRVGKVRSAYYATKATRSGAEGIGRGIAGMIKGLGSSLSRYSPLEENA